MKIYAKYILIVLLLGIICLIIFPSVRVRLLREIKQIGYRIERANDYSNSFIASVSPWTKNDSRLSLSVPIYHQKYSLSCEVASLLMALAYKGVSVSEDELIANLPFATKNPPVRDPLTKEMIWGDPNIGFVGLINGKMPTTGYGVYEKPILDLALQYRDAEILNPATIGSLINELILSHPVIVWGSVINRPKDISWKDNFGNIIPAVEGEHARVAVGFAGAPDSPTHILLIDPVYGKIQMTTKEFVRDWGLLGNRAVAIY